MLKFGAGFLKSRDFIDFHNVLFSSLCKSPEMFMFIGYASNSEGPFDI